MSAEMPFVKSGGFGWLALAAGVVTWDILAPETLSDAFRRAHSHPVSAIMVGASWGVLTAHLFGVIPENADPIHVASVKVRGLCHGHIA